MPNLFLSIEILHALFGGLLIGVAVTVMLLFNGRVTGISGILFEAFRSFKAENLWRYTFLAGLVSGGFLLHFLKPELFLNLTDRSLLTLALAGFLVGFGTLMGNGCTSGHGVCGISRLSKRSLLATLTFILTGMLTATLWSFFWGLH